MTPLKHNTGRKRHLRHMSKRKKFRRDWWGWLRRKHRRDAIPHKEILFPLEERFVPLKRYDVVTGEIFPELTNYWFNVPRGEYPIHTSDIYPPKTAKSSKSRWHPFAHHSIGLSNNGIDGPGDGHVPVILRYYPVDDGPFAAVFDALSDVNFTPELGDMGKWNLSLPPFVVGDDTSAEEWIPSPVDIGQMHHIALRRMLYGSNAELSLVNSVIELKDFLSLKDTVHKLVQTSKLLVRDFLGKGSIFKGHTLRELFATAADGYLQLKFNFQPLVSDMQSVLTAFMRHTDQIAAQVLHNSRPRIKHYKFAFNEFNDEVTETVAFSINDLEVFEDLGPLICPRTISRKVVYNPTEVVYTVRYIPRYSEFQLAHKGALSLLDSLGVNFNPRILWNAIPWSFVIDWFVNIGKWLNDFEIKWMRPTIQVLDLLWSVKRVRKIDVSFTTTGIGFEPSIPIKHTYPQVTEKAYKRSLTSVSSSSLETSGLSLTEFSLGAALAVSVSDRRRHRRVKRRLTSKQTNRRNNKKTSHAKQ